MHSANFPKERSAAWRALAQTDPALLKKLIREHVEHRDTLPRARQHQPAQQPPRQHRRAQPPPRQPPPNISGAGPQSPPNTNTQPQPTEAEPPAVRICAHPQFNEPATWHRQMKKYLKYCSKHKGYKTQQQPPATETADNGRAATRVPWGKQEHL